MKKFIISLLILLHFLQPQIFCAETVFKSNIVNSVAYSVKDEVGSVQYITESKSYHFIKADFNDLSFLLILEEKKESEFLGDEVSKSKINLTAWKMKEGKIESKLWEISQEGHGWEFLNNQIIIIEKGCCDQKDRKYFFDIITGKQISKK